MQLSTAFVREGRENGFPIARAVWFNVPWTNTVSQLPWKAWNSLMGGWVQKNIKKKQQNILEVVTL